MNAKREKSGSDEMSELGLDDFMEFLTDGKADINKLGTVFFSGLGAESRFNLCQPLHSLGILFNEFRKGHFVI